MSLPELQQAASLMQKSQRLLLLVPEKPTLDAFASMVALFLALETDGGEKHVKPGDASLIRNQERVTRNQEERTVDAVSPSHVPPALQFLPGSSQTTMRPQMKPDVVLDIAGPEEIVDVYTEKLSGGIRLHITFAEGISISKDQLETLVRPLPYDVAVILGAADLEELGNTFTAHTDFFYNTPLINIDHQANNEYFGTVNLVDITASSVAEVTSELIRTLTSEKFTADIATALYAGIVAATSSFQKPTTNPRAFTLAAQLMEAKAAVDAVIQHVVKTKPLPLLKLLGRMYARLRHEEASQLFWTILRPLDFQDSGATPVEIPEAMYELTSNIAGFAGAFVLYEHDGRFDVYLLLGRGLQTRRQEIQETLSAAKENGALILTLPADSLETAETQALEKVRSILP